MTKIEKTLEKVVCSLGKIIRKVRGRSSSSSSSPTPPPTGTLVSYIPPMPTTSHNSSQPEQHAPGKELVASEGEESE